VRYHYLQHGTSVCWHILTGLECGPVTADLTSNIVHSSKLLINDVKPDHLLNTVMPLLSAELDLKAL